MLKRTLYRAAAALLALLVALLAARATLGRLAALTELAPVVVARTVIPPYTEITAALVEVVYLPRGAVAQPVYAAAAEVTGRLARLELLPGMLIYRSYAVPASELRYTADAQAVVLGVTVRAEHVPADLLLTGQRVDVWQGGRLVGRGLRVVAITGRPDGQLVVALASSQNLVPALLAASGRDDTALTLAPLVRWTPTAEIEAEVEAKVEVEVTLTPTSTLTSTLTLTLTLTSTPTPGSAVVKPGPAQGLNVRAGPGTTFPVLAMLSAGSRLTPVGRDAASQWVQVCCVAGDQYGWVLAELVDLAGDLTGLPVR